MGSNWVFPRRTITVAVLSILNLSRSLAFAPIASATPSIYPGPTTSIVQTGNCTALTGVCRVSIDPLAQAAPGLCSYARVRARRKIDNCLGLAQNNCPTPAVFTHGDTLFPNGTKHGFCFHYMPAVAVWTCKVCNGDPVVVTPPTTPTGYTCGGYFTCGGTCPAGTYCDGVRMPGDFGRTCSCWPIPNQQPPVTTPTQTTTTTAAADPIMSE